MLGIICRTKSLMVCRITIWKDANRWLKFSVIARLFSLSCSASSSLKDDSSSFLKVLLLIFFYLEKVDMGKIEYDVGFFVRYGCGGVCSG